jgi:PAP2 superfamily
MQERIRRQGSRIWRAQWPIYCEVLLFAFLDLLYETIRALIAPNASAVHTAVANAHDVLRLEQALGVGMEAWSQRVTDAVAGGRFVTSWYYTLAYTPLWIGFFVLVWFWRRANYAFVRNWFWVAHAIALAAFWVYPLAPPRLVKAGLIDTTKDALTLGGALNWFQHLRNEYAAMPSLHIGQSFLFALTLFWLCAAWGRWRNVWWILPVWMAWVTMATANHYLLDGVGGLVTIMAALAIVNWVSARDIRRPWQVTTAAERTDTLDTVRQRAGGSA